MDLTDVYAFESDPTGKTCLLLIANPKSKSGDPDNFSAEATYKVHVGADKLNSDGLAYTVRVRAGVATVGLLEQSQESLAIAVMTLEKHI